MTPTLADIVSVLRLFLVDFPWHFFYLIHVNLEQAFRFVFPRPLKSLKGERILITGSANGLGREICLELSRSGATLICWDVDKRRNEDLVRQLRGTGTNAYAYCVDISNAEKIKAFADKVREDVGSVTMVINNAGIFSLKPIMEYGTDEVDRMFRVNVMSHFWILKEFLPKMVEHKHGHIVATASVACYFCPGLTSCYTSTKHAIHGMMETLRDEMRRADDGSDINIKITTVYPQLIRTNMSSIYKATARFSILTEGIDAAYCAKKLVEGMQRNDEYIHVRADRAFLIKLLISTLPSKVLSSLLTTVGLNRGSIVLLDADKVNNEILNNSS